VLANRASERGRPVAVFGKYAQDYLTGPAVSETSGTPLTRGARERRAQDPMPLGFSSAGCRACRLPGARQANARHNPLPNSCDIGSRPGPSLRNLRRCPRHAGDLRRREAARAPPSRPRRGRPTGSGLGRRGTRLQPARLRRRRRALRLRAPRRPRTRRRPSAAHRPDRLDRSRGYLDPAVRHLPRERR
jgi:hypothetical protein